MVPAQRAAAKSCVRKMTRTRDLCRNSADSPVSPISTEQKCGRFRLMGVIGRTAITASDLPAHSRGRPFKASGYFCQIRMSLVLETKARGKLYDALARVAGHARVRNLAKCAARRVRVWIRKLSMVEEVEEVSAYLQF